MRGSGVCFIAAATFLTALGLTAAAWTRTRAVSPSICGASASTSSRTDGSPKLLKRIARMVCSFWDIDFTKRRISAQKWLESPLEGSYVSENWKYGRKPGNVMAGGIGDIELFCAVVEAGGISAAARHLD